MGVEDEKMPSSNVNVVSHPITVMIELLTETHQGGYSQTDLKEKRVTALQALKILAKELAYASGEVVWSDGAKIEVRRRPALYFFMTTTFQGTIREMSVLSNVVFYHINAQKLDRVAVDRVVGLKHELSDQFSNAIATERAMIQQLKTALPMFTGPHGRFVLFVVLALGITEERDLTAASRLGLDDLFAVIEFRQETGKSLAQVAEELTT